ncbi:MAG TPA: divalent-cation tolerance protein CutA [Rubrivivax sp.]|nr:divalent-cation tolerance protein CutA [Rubrivivax sp.]
MNERQPASTPLLVVTTVGTLDEARAMARALVEQRLAACAQITAIESFYRWQGQVESDPEFRVLFKTRAECWPDIEAAIRALHRYELPAIHAIATEQAYAPYAEWVRESCDAPPRP